MDNLFKNQKGNLLDSDFELSQSQENITSSTHQSQMSIDDDNLHLETFALRSRKRKFQTESIANSESNANE